MNEDDKINDLKWIFIDQITDLTIGAISIRERIGGVKNSNSPPTTNDIAFLRMCTSFLILTLAKLEEALKIYTKEIAKFPNPLPRKCTDLQKIFDKKGIRHFRNTYTAHIHNGTTKRIIKASEGQLLLNKIIGGEDSNDYLNFSNWIFVEDDNNIVSMVIEVRDECLRLVGSKPRE